MNSGLNEKITLKDQNLYLKKDGLEYRIRGFEDIVLSHLRVNIKVSCQDDFFIDIVDLYSQKSRSLFVNKLCSHLKLNREGVKKDLYRIIDTIEKRMNDIEYIESSPKDYKLAYELYSELIQHTLSDLNKPQKELLSLIKEMVKERGLEIFSRKDIRDYTGYPHHKVRNITRDLEELEYLMLESGANGKRKLYRLSEVKEEDTHILRELTRPEDLKWRRWRDIKCSKRQE